LIEVMDSFLVDSGRGDRVSLATSAAAAPAPTAAACATTASTGACATTATAARRGTPHRVAAARRAARAIHARL